MVGPGFFTAMNLPLILGRPFTPQDTKTSPKVAVVSEELARRFFPDMSPLGKRFRMGTSRGEKEFEVIGVVKDAKMNLLRRLNQWPIIPIHNKTGISEISRSVFRGTGRDSLGRPSGHQGCQSQPAHRRSSDVFRTGRPVARPAETDREAVEFLRPPGASSVRHRSIRRHSYSVTQRTREIGIRIALAPSAAMC